MQEEVLPVWLSTPREPSEVFESGDGAGDVKASWAGEAVSEEQRRCCCCWCGCCWCCCCWEGAGRGVPTTLP